jgi:hypothetical protein
MKYLLTCLFLLTACSGALNALDPGVDAARLEERLASRAPDTESYVQTAWLCLLHGRGCARLTHTPDVFLPPPESVLDAHLARALASDGLAAIAPRLDAWLALADVALQKMPDSHADRLLTVAAAALANLALRDDALVRARLKLRAVDVQRWLTIGATSERWRRQKLLADWLPADAPSASRPLPLQVAMTQQPLSRRLFTGLAQLPDTLTPTVAMRPLPSTARPGEPFGLPARDPGVYRLQARFQVLQTVPLLLQLDSPRPVRVWCDGQPLVRVEPGDADARAETWLRLAPGAHVLDLAVPIGQNGQLLGLALVPGEPTLAVPPSPWHATLDLVTAVLHDPQGGAVADLSQQFGRTLLPADAALLRADLRETETLPPASAVDALLAQWPAHADAQLARAVHTREAGQPQLGWQSLQELQKPAQIVDAPPELAVALRADVQLEWAMAYQALGLPDLAAAAAEVAVQAQPDDCKTLARALSIGQDAMNRPLIRRLLDRPLQCPRDALARAFAESMTGRLDAALASLLRAQMQPVHAREASGLARLMAQTLHQPVPPRPPWGEDPQGDDWQALQDAEQRHDAKGTHQALSSLLTDPGLPLEARQKAMQSGAQPIWQPFLKDGEAVAQAEVPDAFADGSATVWLLDQEIVQLLPDGGAIRRVHQVVRVREDAAADAVGEIRVGQGADLELARTILPDGSLVLPAETNDKETISLRAVAAGTTVEFAQVAYVPPDDPATGATRLPLFHMQSTEAPVVLSEYIVLVPQGLQVALEASAAAGQAVVKPMGAFTAYIFSRSALPRVRNEPRAARPERVLPTVRALVRPSLAAALEPWNEALAAYVASRDATLRSWRATLAQAPESLTRWQKLAGRLALTVQNQHEGGPPGRPETALGESKGDRAATFYTLAKQVGADACLVRVLPLARMPAPDPLAVNAAVDPDDYGLELVRLRVQLPQTAAMTEIWYDPAMDGGRLNHVRAGLRGRQGLLCGCAVPDVRVTVPPLGEDADRRVIDVVLDWDADGRLAGVVHERLEGAVAGMVRTFLRGNGGDDHELVVQLADTAFGNAALQLLSIDGLAGDGDISLAYEVTLAADRGRAEALELDLWAEQMGQAYGQLPTRNTPLLFSHALDQLVTVRVHNRGDAVGELPLDVAVVLPDLRYDRRARRDGQAIVVTRQLWTRPAVVQPAQYPDFAKSLRAVDAADHVRLHRLP